jgi:hypothetical protein
MPQAEAALLDLGHLVERIKSVRASPEELAELATNRIISVGDKSHFAIRDQAHAFREGIRDVIRQYVERAVYAEQLNVAQALRDVGHPELVPVIADRMK